MDTRQDCDELDERIMDALIELLKQMSSLGQSIGHEFGLSGSDTMALHKIDGPISMKELSQRLGCDASFVTAIADTLEKHGLARREPSLSDRRRKNLVLTECGNAIRDQITKEVAARMPWSKALDIGEREHLLGLLRKMLDPANRGHSQAAGGGDGVTPAMPVSS